MKKVINLDDKKNIIEIVLGGDSFIISRVVLRMRDMYASYIKLSADYLQQVEKENDKEKLSEVAEEYAYKKAEMLDDMLFKLLEDNGYEYNKIWWANHVESYNDIENFIVQALMKDTDPEAQKKTAEAMKI
jgi:hypothetical protein